MCIVGVSTRAQSLSRYASTPGYDNDNSLASHPTLTLDSLTGYLHYSFTVNYPEGLPRTGINFGGSSIYMVLCFTNYPYQSYPVEFNNETEDYTTLPAGQVTHSGSVYVGNLYSVLTQVGFIASTSFTFAGFPNTTQSYQMMDEYEFIP